MSRCGSPGINHHGAGIKTSNCRPARRIPTDQLERYEAELNAMAEKQRLAAEEIARKNKELEVLSSKLAKYLSPQVYKSIFTGAQDVKLASQRKKLTVFFSDVAGFVETTDKMELEDLTTVLNHYLTEMSKVALEHGATLDKHIER